MNSFEDFVAKLVYFGGSLSNPGPELKAEDFIDPELFFLQGSLWMGQEVRVTQCFLTWLNRYGALLSPSKTRRLIKTGTSYDPAILGAFIGLIQETEGQRQNWAILKRYLKKRSKNLLFNTLPPPKTRNPHFEKFGIIAHPFSLEEKKYLREPRYVLEHCPELRFRALGISVVAADLRAYLFKKKNVDTSLYKIAQETHHQRTHIYLFHRLFVQVGSL